VEVHPEHCQGCGLCVPVCPAEALELNEVEPGTGRFVAHFLDGDCRADELCFFACPEPGALTVHRIGRVFDVEP